MSRSTAKEKGRREEGKKIAGGESSLAIHFSCDAVVRGADGGQEVIFHGRRSRTDSLYAKCLPLFRVALIDLTEKAKGR